jgi:hypothetical protein
MKSRKMGWAGKRTRGRYKHSWEDVRIYLSEIAWKGVDWIHLTQDRDRWLVLVMAVMNPSDSTSNG